jgi:hypothetical protein
MNSGIIKNSHHVHVIFDEKFACSKIKIFSKKCREYTRNKKQINILLYHHIICLDLLYKRQKIIRKKYILQLYEDDDEKKLTNIQNV